MTSVRVNALFLVAGNAYYAVSQWLVLIIIARLGSPEAVGVFSYALAVTAPVTMFFNFGLRSILASDVDGKIPFRFYEDARLVTAGLGFVACLLILMVVQNHVLVVAAIAAAKSVESLLELRYGLAQRGGRLDLVSLSLIFRGTLGAGSIGLLYWATGSLQVAALGYSGSWFISLLAIRMATRPLEQDNYENLSRRESYRALFKPALALGITALMVNLGPNIPRFVLEAYHGTAELGIYSSMAYFIIVGSIVVSALGQALVPVLAKQYQGGNLRDYWLTLTKSLLAVVALGIAGVVLATFLGHYVMGLIYGDAFARHADLLPLVAVAATIGYIGNILGYAVSSARIFIGQAPAFAMTAIVALVASLLLIPHLGLVGAVYTLLLSSLSNCVAPIILLWYQMRSTGGSERA